MLLVSGYSFKENPLLEKAESTEGKEDCMKCDISAEKTDNSDSERCCVYNKYQYPFLCEIPVGGTGISNRDASKVINASLKVMGLNTQDNLLMPSKLRRQRILHRTEAATNHSIVNQELLCTGFDGRADEIS